MTCAQGLLRLLWGGAEVGVLRDWLCSHPNDKIEKFVGSSIKIANYTTTMAALTGQFASSCARCVDNSGHKQ